MILRLVLLINLLLTVGVGFTSAQTVSIPDSNLRAAIEDKLEKAPGATITQADMARLTDLSAADRGITDLTGLKAATNLVILDLGPKYDPIEGRDINRNSISDLTPLAGLTRLARLHLEGNQISDISPLTELTSLVILGLGDNNISDITALKGLTNLHTVTLWNNNISDISPLVENSDNDGFGPGEKVNVSENPLSKASIEIHIPALKIRGVEVLSSNLKPVLAEHLLALPAGLSLIHIPLEVTTVDGLTRRITTVGDLYDALGGSIVNFIVTYDPVAQEWLPYFGDADRDGPGDRTVTDGMGILVGMSVRVTVRLNGNPLVTGGDSTIALYGGLNLLGLPLKDERITRVSDLLTLDGFLDNTLAIVPTEAGEFKLVARAGDPGDIPVRKGQSFIILVQRAANVSISGENW